MTGIVDKRGVLYPARLPEFERILPPKDLSDRVYWFWISRWSIAPGRVSRQQLLPFPLMNLVVQPDEITLAGPASGASHKDLSGQGWAVAALLKPAAGFVFSKTLHTPVKDLLDSEVAYPSPDLAGDIRELHSDTGLRQLNQECVDVFSTWIQRSTEQVDATGLQANSFIEFVSATRSIIRVDQVAEQLNMTPRSLQRLSMKYLGLSPLSVIRRYRLQEAAQQLREDPGTSIAQIAVNLDYSDQAHLASDFRKVLGFSPSNYRLSG
ncbi:AraC family transcriptional regulator [Glutamicibacter uratoxydans]|uniref:AraC family transcriptional regulator n=1 Tax=Glutamicibacter uratoxydans TaxID=43667 RepID=A0A4Y4DTE1_GLUUR|nr:helix-turn-helix transcriptional regulator [Glutamicibacter uratoxydans]GED07164.1 AraC family transcriptional regulator [Glutamicibacter uratoxydans]